MGIVGEGFDGDWYAQPFEDYFITQWGPDRQSVANAEYWGLVVNNVFTNVGGCQQQVNGGDEVIWVYDAFSSRPRLLLYPGDYGGGPLQLTAEAQLGIPFEIEVDAWDSFNEGGPPTTPQRSTETFAGATVAPVVESAKGFEEIDADSSAAEVTDADGGASITFATSGWHRLKATRIVAGEEVAVRSNRLDVCVPPPAASDCGPPPSDDQVRTPPPPGPGGEEPGGEGPGTPGPPEQPPPSGGGGAAPRGAVAGPPAPSEFAPVRLQLPRLDRSRLAEGLVGVSWKLLDRGPGIRRWEISSLRLGRRGARYLVRAGGRDGSSATLRLPPGAGYRLRLTVTDVLGRSSSAVLGKVQVPR
jgi:hypothetical protein